MVRSISIMLQALLSLLVLHDVQSFRILQLSKIKSQSTSLSLSLGEGIPADVDLMTFAPQAVLTVAALAGVATGAGYWKLQYTTAGMLGGIPSKSKVVELDALDGKNIFYLPKGCDYTAVMNPKETDAKKMQEKMRINEQLVLECVGKANVNGLGLRGKMRTKSIEVERNSADIVVSMGAISRAGADQKGVVVNEALRILKPGGLFLFLEQDGSGGETLELIAKFFPKEIEVRAAPAVSSSSKSSGEGGGKKAKKTSSKKDSKGFVAKNSQNEEDEEQVDTVVEGGADGAGLEEVATSTSVVVERKVGIVSQQLSIFPSSYTTGIAIKP